MRIDYIKINYGTRTILNIDNFDLKIKGLTALYGNSGEGKTTFLDALYGLKNDFPIKHNTTDKKIEYILQEYTLFSGLTVYENFSLKYILEYGKMPTYEEVKNHLTNTDLLVDLNMKANLLSGGEKKRLQIAIGLISNPDLLLVDEPTSSLDDKNSENIIKLLKIISKKYDILVVTHDSKFKQISDRNYELSGGKLHELS